MGEIKEEVGAQYLIRQEDGSYKKINFNTDATQIDNLKELMFSIATVTQFTFNNII